MTKAIVLCLLIAVCCSRQILQPQTLKPFMFTEEIDGRRKILNPLSFLSIFGSLFPEETYEIAVMKSTQQFLPPSFPATPVYAYAGKDLLGRWKPSFRDQQFWHSKEHQ